MVETSSVGKLPFPATLRHSGSHCSWHTGRLSQGTESQVMAMMQFGGCVWQGGGIVSWGESRRQFPRKAVLLRVPQSRSHQDGFPGC